MRSVGIVLALGDIYDCRGIGNLRHPVDGVADRFRAIMAVCDSDFVLVSTAGYSKESPQAPVLERQVSLCRQFERYLCEIRSSALNKLIAVPLCWSTRNEVRVGIKTAISRGEIDRDEPVELIIASNWTHLPRIWLYAKVYMPKKWKLRLVVAKRKFSFGDSFLVEPAKTVRDAMYFIRLILR